MFSSHHRIHNSKRKIKKLKGVVEQVSDMKPRRLWYGFDDSWLTFIKNEMPHLEGKYFYEIDINSCNVLQLKTERQIRLFGQEYKVIDRDLYTMDKKLYDLVKKSIFKIDWKRVSNEYDGIEINPYQSEMRMDNTHIWYYSWDVASGCVWNVNCLKLHPLV